MKKIFLGILVSCVLALAGCGGTDTVGENVRKNSPSQYWWSDQTMVQSGEDGYYILEDVTGLVKYYDLETGETLPLCSKPECDHGGEECNALIRGIVPVSLRWGGDALYAVTEDEGKSCLIRIVPDGSGLEELTVLWEETETETYNVVSFQTDQGYGYYQQRIANEYGEEFYSVCRVALEKDSSPEELFRSVPEQRFFEMKLYEGDLYYIRRDYREGENPGELCRYRLTEGKEEILYTGLSGGYGFIGKNLYYTGEEEGVWQISLETGERSKLSLPEESGPLEQLVCDGEYIYILNAKQAQREEKEQAACRIYAEDGRRAGEVTFPLSELYLYFGGDSREQFGLSLTSGLWHFGKEDWG